MMSPVLKRAPFFDADAEFDAAPLILKPVLKSMWLTVFTPDT
jgi:hypothetical protein